MSEHGSGPQRLARLRGLLDRTSAGLGSLGRQAVSGAGRQLERVREPLRQVRTGLRGEGEVLHPDRLPDQGPVILVATHRHLIDARVLQSHLPRPVRLVDVDDLEEAVHQRRAGEDEKSDPWTRALGQLARGEVVLVFPEGSPSPDEAVHKGRAAVGWLVLAAQRLARVPVVPVVVDVGAARVVIGQPLDFSRHADLRPDRTLARGTVDEIMDALSRTAGRPYADTHTTTARAERRSASQRRRDRRRVEALARRDAALRAAVDRKFESAAERADLAERAARALQEAREAQRLREGQPERGGFGE